MICSFCHKHIFDNVVEYCPNRSRDISKAIKSQRDKHLNSSLKSDSNTTNFFIINYSRNIHQAKKMGIYI